MTRKQNNTSYKGSIGRMEREEKAFVNLITGNAGRTQGQSKKDSKHSTTTTYYQNEAPK